jgi:hypothetical protein
MFLGLTVMLAHMQDDNEVLFNFHLDPQHCCSAVITLPPLRIMPHLEMNRNIKRERERRLGGKCPAVKAR